MTKSEDKRISTMKKEVGKKKNFWFPKLEKNIRATSIENAKKIVEKMCKT